jgi:NADH-quinone oxidoreductase subunit E
MGACGDGPVALVNNVRMCAKMTPEEADRILAGLE